MNAEVQSDALHRRTVLFVDAFEARRPMPESFDALALDLVRFQHARVPGYARLCAARGVNVGSLTSPREAPAVPTDAFKLASVFAFDPASAGARFLTSGTTVGARGTHAMRHITTYDRAAVAFGRAMLTPSVELPLAVLVLGPSATEAPESSLAHMNTEFVRRWGQGGTLKDTYYVRGGDLDVSGFQSRVARLEPHLPALVLATSFALVHLLDALNGATLQLPPGSRVMQTGGFKGKSREVDATALRASVAATFGIDPRMVIGEYGMTELSSQFWEATVVDAHAQPGVYVEPPWARVVAVDPVTLRPVAEGDVGIARIEDLANVDSAFAVLTQDRVRRTAGGFELLGRAPGAPPRGCSIALDEMLGAP